MLKDDFAKHLGFSSYHRLLDVTEVIKDIGGDVTLYVSKLPNGKWIAWDDAEIALDRVSFFDAKHDAVEFHKGVV